jgi:hypothetical protein
MRSLRRLRSLSDGGRWRLLAGRGGGHGRYGDCDLTHTTTSGLSNEFGTAPHDTDLSLRNVGGFLLTPQYAVISTSSNSQLDSQAPNEQFRRMIRSEEGPRWPEGPGSPCGPGEPGGPGEPLPPLGP